MSAPERIWARPNHNGAVGECWHDARSEAPEKPWEFNEYIRADLATSEADALRAENERLKAALSEILEHCDNFGRGNPVVDERIADRCEDTARAALGDTP